MNHAHWDAVVSTLTDSLKVGVRLAAHIMTDRIDLNLVAGAGMQILDDQIGAIGADGALLVGAVALVVHLVAILLRVDIAAPADVQALRYAAQLLDDGRGGSGVARQAARIGADAIGQGLHLNVVTSARQQLRQLVLCLRRLQRLRRCRGGIRIIELLVVAEQKGSIFSWD